LDKSGFDVELAVFRIVQEALSNIHRHSHSSTATVIASCDGRTFTLEIADQGKGITTGSAEGVGLASMRERVRLLKGELEIRTGPTGTTITVRLPMAEMASSASTAA
jgi:two-component system, NarL family, sensor kinase